MRQFQSVGLSESKKMEREAALLGLFAALILSVSCVTAFADESPTVQLVVPTIDYPAAGVTGTRVFGINDLGNLSFQVSIGADVFVGTRINGHYSTPSQPNDTDVSADAEDINNFNVVVGNFFDGSTFHGFLLKNGSYTTFDVNVPNVGFTVAIGIDDFGVVSGVYGTPNENSPDKAFRQIGKKETDLNVDSAVGSFATGTNDLLQTAGYFSESDPFLTEATCNCHGVVWDAFGHPKIFDIKNAVSTLALGISIPGWICGRFYDNQSNVHGFVYNLYSKKFVIYNYPNAISTSLNGINNAGYIGGRYTDIEGVAHGFIARIIGE
jgi:hypothetical protein